MVYPTFETFQLLCLEVGGLRRRGHTENSRMEARLEGENEGRDEAGKRGPGGMKVGGRRQRGWKGEAGVREGANKGRQERGRQESTTQGAKQS